MLTALVVLQSVSLVFMMGTYGAIARLVNSFAKIVDILSNIRIHQVRQMDPRDVPWPEREN